MFAQQTPKCYEKVICEGDEEYTDLSKPRRVLEEVYVESFRRNLDQVFNETIRRNLEEVVTDVVTTVVRRELSVLDDALAGIQSVQTAIATELNEVRTNIVNLGEYIYESGQELGESIANRTDAIREYIFDQVEALETNGAWLITQIVMWALVGIGSCIGLICLFFFCRYMCNTRGCCWFCCCFQRCNPLEDNPKKKGKTSRRSSKEQDEENKPSCLWRVFCFWWPFGSSSSNHPEEGKNLLPTKNTAATTNQSSTTPKTSSHWDY